jgi:HSP20 family protein
MTNGKWDPFGNIGSLQERINRMFDDAFPHRKDTDLAMGSWVPAADIYDSGSSLTIRIDLPGVDRDAIALEVRNEVLTIAGERLPDAEHAEQNYYRRERAFGKFKRSFSLPGLIEPGAVTATFKQGVLEINVPRPQQEQPQRIVIE